MPGVEIDRSTLWKRARQDKHGNIPDPKVAEKAKLIDDLQKQVSEGKVSVSGSNDVLTMALGPEHPGRVRGLGAGISPRQYFNLPKPQRMSFDDRLKDSLRVLLQEETKKMEAKAREEALRMEARTKQLVEAEREHLLTEKTKKKKSEEKEEEKKEEKKEEKQNENEKDKKEGEEKHDVEVCVDYSNIEVPSSLKSLCSYVETIPKEETINFTIEKEVFGEDRNTFILPEDISQIAGMEEIGATVVAVYMRCLYEQLKKANMCSMVGFIDPALVSANAGTITSRSRIVASRLQKTDGEQIFMMPYNPGDHLYFNGVDQSYKNWTFHGEPWEATTNASRNVEDDDGHSRYSFVSEEIDMDDNDFGDFGSDPYEFANVIGDGDQPECTTGCRKYTKLSALVKLYNLKAKHGMSDVCFTELLILQGDLLPEGNTIPTSMYEAKKTLCALGLSYEKMHACPNDCILYRKEYEDSTNCPSCGISRWKEGKD
ncbi:unnamed protein product, partial [Prunus brigantina]